MIISSLALVLAAAMPVAPTSNPIHLHPKVKVLDERVNFTLFNPTMSFRDVIMGGHTYTVESHHTLGVKAPAGTVVFVASPGRSHKRGEFLLEVRPQENNTRISLD